MIPACQQQKLNNVLKVGQFYACWWPGSFIQLDINSYGIDKIRLLGILVWHQECHQSDIQIFQEVNLPDTHCVLQVFVLVRHIAQQYIKTETETLAHGQLWNHIDNYRKISKISCTLLGYEIVDHSDVVGASPVGAAPTTSSFSTWHLASRDSAKTGARQS